VPHLFVGLLSELLQFGACKNKDLLHVRAHRADPRPQFPPEHSYIALEKKSEQVRENQSVFREARSVDCGRTPGRYLLWCLMFSGGFFFLDQFVNKPWHAATAETPRWLVFCFPFWVTHEAFVERLFRSYEVIVIKSQLAALAAL
jgi:hypothetical protein